MVGIYKITNTATGNVYIGKATNVKRRWKQHINALNKGEHARKLQFAWNKYGESNFIFEVEQKCEVKELNDLEAFYIQLYDSINNGYNSKTVVAEEKIEGKKSLAELNTVTVTYNRRLLLASLLMYKLEQVISDTEYYPNLDKQPVNKKTDLGLIQNVSKLWVPIMNNFEARLQDSIKRHYALNTDILIWIEIDKNKDFFEQFNTLSNKGYVNISININNEEYYVKVYLADRTFWSKCTNFINNKGEVSYMLSKCMDILRRR